MNRLWWGHVHCAHTTFRSYGQVKNTVQVQTANIVITCSSVNFLITRDNSKWKVTHICIITRRCVAYHFNVPRSRSMSKVKGQIQCHASVSMKAVAGLCLSPPYSSSLLYVVGPYCSISIVTITTYHKSLFFLFSLLSHKMVETIDVYNEE